MRADRQELHRRRSFGRKVRRRIEVLFRHDDLLAEGTVGMNAEDPDRRAAIGLALAAGNAAAAGDIGIDDHKRFGRERAAGAGLDHRCGDLVAHDARIFEKGVLALEDMIVGAANADAADCDRRFRGVRVLGRQQLSWRVPTFDPDASFDHRAPRRLSWSK
jgi:hypothetical protein